MTEIDDEMVKRFRQVSGPYLGLPKPPGGALVSKEAISAWKNEIARGILEKTLNPPPKPEPEIEVSEGMIEAAKIANPIWEWGPSITQRIKEIYRAMRVQEIKEAEIVQQWKFGPMGKGAAYAAKSAPQGVSSAAPVKETGGGVGRKMRTFTVHSRKTDELKEDCSHVWPHRRRDD